MPPARTNSESSIPKRKPGKPLTACAECRRSKLRCDGQVPCNTCTARGCKSICPNQTLTLRKKYTYVLNGTDELHHHIEVLVERIIALEEGLSMFQSCHSLLAPHLLKIKDTITTSKDGGCDSSTQSSDTEKETEHPIKDNTGTTVKQEHQLEDILGTLSLNSSGETTYFGTSTRTDHAPKEQRLDEPSTLPPSLLELCHTEYVRPDEPALLAEIVARIPPLSQTVRFCNNYIRHCRYKFSLLFSREELFNEIVEPVYNPKNPQDLDTAILAIMFAIIAIGAKYSYSLPINSVEAQDYFRLAFAVSKLRPPSKHATLNNMRLLIYMSYYQHSSIDEGNHSPWMMMNEAVGMAISAGLHINSEHWNLPSHLVNKRHRTFWSLFVTETMLSLSAGRPPSISLTYVDCPPPTGLDAAQLWVIEYSKVLHTIGSTVLCATTPSYKTILALDKRVRDLVLPDRVSPSPAVDGKEEPEIIFQRQTLNMLRETALLFLHKPYFMVALRDPAQLQNHKYMPSVTAICRSASRLIKGQRAHWLHQPTRPISERLDIAWSYTLSAMVVMFQIATKAPTSELALVASQCLRIAEALMLDAAPTCPFAAQHLDLARQMSAKASSDVLVSSGAEFIPENKALLEEIDKISGKTHLSVLPERSPPPPQPESVPPPVESYDMSRYLPAYDWVKPTQASLSSDVPGFDTRRFDSVFQSVQADAPVEEQYMHPDLVHEIGLFNHPHHHHSGAPSNNVTTGEYSAEYDPSQAPFWGPPCQVEYPTPSTSVPPQTWSHVPFGGAWEAPYHISGRPWATTL